MKNTLVSILTTPTEQLRGYLNKIASHSGRDCWLLEPEKKEGKVCIVAHIDTVWDDNVWGFPKRIKRGAKTLVHDKDRGMIWSANGLGADDRAGVYAALKLFRDTPEPYKPYILFTDFEECGGAGASEASDLFKTELSRCNFLIELDRANALDAVFYNGESNEFVEYVLAFGFKEAIGSFSDISIVCPKIEKCGVNLSIGYYFEHTEREYLNTNIMNSTIKKVGHILLSNHEANQLWHLEATAKYRAAYGSAIFDSLSSDSYEFEYECPYCYEELNQEDLTYNGNDVVYGHCRRCTERFEIY